MARNVFSGLVAGRRSRQERDNAALNELMNLVKLRESGFNVDQKPRTFFGGGGYKITPDPDYVSTSSLQKKQLQNELLAFETPAQKAERDLSNQKAIKQYEHELKQAELDRSQQSAIDAGLVGGADTGSQTREEFFKQHDTANPLTLTQGRIGFRTGLGGNVKKDFSSQKSLYPKIFFGGELIDNPDYVEEKDRKKAEYEAFLRSKYPSAQERRDKQKYIREIYETAYGNRLKRENLDNAQKALSKIPQGRMGNITITMLQELDPSNEILGEWQTVQTQLLEAAMEYIHDTKGAISDPEMQSFLRAVSGGDLTSIARSTRAFNKIRNYLDMKEQSLLGSFEQIYGENPDTWFESYNRPNSIKFGDSIKSESGDSNLRQEAIKILKENGKMISENNISAVIKKLSE